MGFLPPRCAGVDHDTSQRTSHAGGLPHLKPRDYDCAAIVSRRAAEMAGLDVKGRKLHQALVQGRGANG